MRKSWNIAALAASVLALSAQSAVAAECDRACLDKTAARAVSALMTGELAHAPFAPNLRFTENGQVARLEDSGLRGARPGPYRRVFAQPSAGAVGVYATAIEPDRQAVYSVRLKVVGGKITELETVVAHRGEASMAAPEALTAPPFPKSDEVLPPARRPTQAQLIAAANAYFDGLQTADGSKVPSAPTCNRVENGVQTTNRQGGSGSGCNALSNFTYIKSVRDRRFPVIDLERGLVWSQVVFDIPGGLYKDPRGVEVRREPRSILIGELFKLDGGQIQDIEVVMRNAPLGAPDGWSAPKP